MTRYGTYKPRFYPTKQGNLPSVTTILSVLSKPALIQWAADEAVKYLQSEYRACEGIMVRSAFEEARFAYKGISREALETGTGVHGMIELYFDGLINEDADLRFLQAIEATDDDSYAMIENFVHWCAKHDVHPIAVEKKVIGNGYAGRVDLVAEINAFWKTKSWCKKNGVEWTKATQKERVVAVMDVKTSKAYYEEMGMQLAAYASAYCKELRDTIFSAAKFPDSMGIIRIDKKSHRVNYKDYTKDWALNIESFEHLVKFYHLQCIEEVQL